jgi:gamma-glutamyltranspeptidase / glutathione hydrolase
VSRSFGRADRPTGNINGTRSPVVGRRGVIATSQPLASAAGLRILQDGGNAVDAAVTAAAVLAVVEPTMTGPGGDVFAILYDAKSQTLRALNSSGRAGADANADALKASGVSEMPVTGARAVTVPGAVAGWSELLERHGTIGLEAALAPAVAYARDGFPVAEIVAGQWAEAVDVVAGDPASAAVFLPGGRAPEAGAIFRNRDLANTLEQIGREGRDVLYKGPIGAALVDAVRQRGGFLTQADLAAHVSDWVEPIRSSYRGYELYEMPPNTQGFVALEMLNILEGYDIASMGHNSAEYLHTLVEAKRIAFADRAAYLADPRQVPQPLLESLISKKYAAARRRDIDPRRAAANPAPRSFDGRDLGDTVYLAAADGDGNAISFINSLFGSFGSGVVAPGTGVVLHNRGAGFTLERDHPNRLAPGKRPLHTLVPAFLMKDGRPLMPFGVMGGDNQAQAHAQIVVNLVDFGMNVQEAGDAARVRHGAEGLAVESAIAQRVRSALAERGHRVIDGRGLMGGYQAVMIDSAAGVLAGGSDPRKDGLALGW